MLNAFPPVLRPIVRSVGPTGRPTIVAVSSLEAPAVNGMKAPLAWLGVWMAWYVGWADGETAMPPSPPCAQLRNDHRILVRGPWPGRTARRDQLSLSLSLSLSFVFPFPLPLCLSCRAVRWSSSFSSRPLGGAVRSSLPPSCPHSFLLFPSFFLPLLSLLPLICERGRGGLLCVRASAR